MAKRKSKTRKRTQNQNVAKQEGPNLFERLSSKKRFDVLGKRTKGQIRQPTRLRTDAYNKRKETLLVEYRQLKKSNAFNDRRFGEDDDTLSPEDRALLRYQKQRMRDLAGSRFNLPDTGEGEELTLTHMGKSLALDDDDESGNVYGGISSDDEDLDADGSLTAALHFGGGFVPSTKTRVIPEASDPATRSKEDGDAEEELLHKTKKEVMEEVIAKSKLARALKAQQRGEDLEKTEALDAQWKELMRHSARSSLFRPKGDTEETTNTRMEDAFDDKKFDALTKELIFDAKAKPGDRTLKPEELEQLEQQRLEMLEKQRQQREKGLESARRNAEALGGDDLEDDFGDITGVVPEPVSAVASMPASEEPTGGYAARRAKRARLEAEQEAERRRLRDEGDDEDEDEESDEEEELTELDRRRQQQAAGDHPLQNTFRKVAEELLRKHGMIDLGGSDEEDDESDDERGNESDDSDASSSDAEEGEESSDGGEKEEQDEEPMDETDRHHHGGEVNGDRQRKKDQDGDAPGHGSSSSLLMKSMDQNRDYPRATPDDDLPPMTMTFTPSLPENYHAFKDQVSGLSASELGEYVHRMLAFNRSTLKTDSRKKLQLLYGIVSQHFASLAAESPPSLPHLDAMTACLLEMTPHVPYYATVLARARLERAYASLTTHLKDPLLKATSWPSVKTILLLKLLTTLFPVTDKRHPVLTPASLLVGHALALCPLARPCDVASGLLLASIAQHMHSEARRVCPESLNFAVRVLKGAVTSNEWNAAEGRGASSNNASSRDDAKRRSTTFSLESDIDFLKIDVQEGEVAPVELSAEGLPEMDLGRVLALLSQWESRDRHEAETDAPLVKDAKEGYFSSVEFKISALAASVKLLRRIAVVHASNDALPELMAPAERTLHVIIDAVSGLSKGDAPNGSTKTTLMMRFVGLCRDAAAEIAELTQAARKRRLPVINPALTAPKEVKQYNPRFEEGFAIGKDYDPDRERAERRRLQRQIRKEERGAIREFRKDASFMAHVRDQEKARRQAELDASARRALSFLQQQESDFKSGGQGGMWKKKRRK